MDKITFFFKKNKQFSFLTLIEFYFENGIILYLFVFMEFIYLMITILKLLKISVKLKKL